MKTMIRMMLLGLLAGGLVFFGACVRVNGTGPKPGQDETPSPTPTPTPTLSVTPAATPAATPTPAPAAAVTPAPSGEPGEVEISWDTTVFNRDLVQGFHIWRGISKEGPFAQVTDELIDIDAGEDGILRFVDQSVVMDVTYFYRIQIVTKVGDRLYYRDPIEITVNRPRGLTPQ